MGNFYAIGNDTPNMLTKAHNQYKIINVGMYQKNIADISINNKESCMSN